MSLTKTTPRLSPSEKTRDLARLILDRLTRDTRRVSTIVANLDDLCTVDDWTVEQQHHYGTCRTELGEILSRYRTGDSILALPQERRCGDVLHPGVSCAEPHGHDGSHRDSGGKRRWS